MHRVVSADALHLAMELFKLTAGVDLLHVPFRGAAPAVIDVIGGHTKVISATVSTLAPQVRAGKLRALGTSGTKRTTILPDVPTVEEGGVAGYDAGNWIGLAAPGGTPPAIIALLQKEVSAMLENPEHRKQIALEGSELMRMTPAEFATFMDNGMVKWGRVVKPPGSRRSSGASHCRRAGGALLPPLNSPMLPVQAPTERGKECFKGRL